MCGKWERKARALGFVVDAVEGLTVATFVDLPGLDPVLMVPTWADGRMREYMLAYLVAELWVRRYGEADDWATWQRAERQRWAS